VTIASKSMHEREKYKNEKKQTNPSRKEQEGQQS
jgi:hypothetical protein